MEAVLKVRDSIRDFLRKYDEFTSPMLRFIASLIFFVSINKMFGYSDLFTKSIVVVLMSIICAILPDAFFMFVAGVDVVVNAFCVSWQVGAVFTVFFIALYCIYTKFFPKWAYVVFLVPVCFQLGIPVGYMVPIIVVIVAGAGGAIPAAFGVLLYYLADLTKSINEQLQLANDSDDVEVFKQYVDDIIKSKDIRNIIIIFVVSILVAGIIYMLPFAYSWYVGAAMASVMEIIVGIIIADSFSELILGALVGLFVGFVMQFCKGILDYPRVEFVQYDDDDYYYYVKAIPKIKAEKKTKTKKAKTKRKAASEEE